MRMLTQMVVGMAAIAFIAGCAAHQDAETPTFSVDQTTGNNTPAIPSNDDLLLESSPFPFKAEDAVTGFEGDFLKALKELTSLCEAGDVDGVLSQTDKIVGKIETSVLTPADQAEAIQRMLRILAWSQFDFCTFHGVKNWSTSMA